MHIVKQEKFEGPLDLLLDLIKKEKPHKQGFTLIEMLIAVSIFSIVVVMGIGALLVSGESLRKTTLTRAAMENVNIAMESMSKRMRTGSFYYCGSGGTGPRDVKNCDGGRGSHCLLYTSPSPRD